MSHRDRIHSVRSIFQRLLPPLVAGLALAVSCVRPAWAQLTTDGSQIFQQGAGGVPGAADGDERFGTALERWASARLRSRRLFSARIPPARAVSARGTKRTLKGGEASPRCAGSRRRRHPKRRSS